LDIETIEEEFNRSFKERAGLKKGLSLDGHASFIKRISLQGRKTGSLNCVHDLNGFHELTIESRGDYDCSEEICF
jgi:hypothetical protein